MAVPYTFATATSSIPLSQLDSNFNTPITLGNTAVYLGGTYSTIGNLTLTNVTISSGSANVTYGNANAVVYTNTSNVGVTSTALTFDGTNLGVGGAVTGSTGASTNFTVNGSSTASAQFGIGGAVTNYIFNDSAQMQVWANGASTALKLGTGQNNPITFFSNNTEQMRLTSTGLGIGTSSPAYKLDVSGTSRITGILTMSATGGFIVNSAASTSTKYIDIENTSGSLFAGVSSSTGTGIMSSGRAYSAALAGQAGIQFSGNNGTTVHMDLDTSGNLGLGVTPSAWLSTYKGIDFSNYGSIYGRTATNSLEILTNAYRNSSSNYIYKNNGTAQYIEAANGAFAFYNSASGTAGNAITFTQAMTLDASGNLGVGTTSPGAKLQVNGTDVILQNSSGTFNLQLYQTGRYDGRITVNSSGMEISQRQALPLLFSTSDTERARIDTSGNLLVGTTSAIDGGSITNNYNGNNVKGLVLNDTTPANTHCYIAFDKTSGTQIGTITNNSNTGVLYNVTSDYRLKTVTGVVSGSGERIDALEPVEYEWKETGLHTRGFLAHKFQEVYAGSVTGTKDAVDEQGNPVYQQMQAATSEVIADLVAEIQSLRKRLADAGL